MISRRMTMEFVAALLASFAAIAEGPALDYAVVVGRVFPDCEVTFDGEKLAGTLTRSGEAVGFAVAGAKEFELEGEPHVLFVITYPEDREARFLPFLEGGAVDKPTYHEYLVVAPVRDPAKATWKLLDEDATSVHPRNMEIYDFIGDGTLQLNAEMTHSYFVTDPNEVIQTRRYQLYTLPALEKIFDATTLKVVANQYTMDMVSGFQVKIKGRSSKDDLRIELLDVTQKDGGVVEIPFRNGRFDYDPPPPTTRDKARTAKRNDVWKTLKIQVVTPNGVPISGALVSGEVSWSRIDWTSQHEDIAGQTDEHGDFEVRTPGNVEINVSADGYYSVRKVWRGDDIPTEKILIDLEAEHERVALIDGSISVLKDTDADRYTFGIVFVDEDSQAAPDALTELREEANLWVELYRTGPSVLEGDATERAKNNDIWHIKITGQNGWRILGKTDSSQEMREAPEGPYEGSIDGSFDAVPKGLYLEQNGGERYGRLTMKVGDRSKFGKINRYCSMSYNVQAEPSGTRSLNRKR